MKEAIEKKLQLNSKISECIGRKEVSKMEKNRKEYTSKESHFGIPGTEYHITKLYDDRGRKSEGIGKTEEESREKAYQSWREKYK